MVPEDASLPALKSLSLSLGQFQGVKAFEKLISACPLLEELFIDQILCEFWKCSPVLSSLTLKRLTARCYAQNSGIMSFGHPSLLFLRYAGFQKHYPVVNLDSLVEAELELLSHLGPHNPSNLIKGLRNVKILNLVTPETVEFFGIHREAMPVFANLVHLIISYRHAYRQHVCLHGSHVLSLLNNSPNLQTLVIKGPLCHKSNFCETECECSLECPRLSSCPVKILELTMYEGDDTKVLEQMKHFLEGFPCLELVKVCASAKDDNEKLRITTDLQMLPRASSKCKIQVEFS